MTDLGNIKFVKGSLRYKRAPEVGVEFIVPFFSKQKELDDFFIQTTVNLPTVYDEERQNSFLYIPTCKFQLIFDNTYNGTAMPEASVYTPINNNLYYLNEEESKINQFLTSEQLQWPGYPQYNEFAFIRTDNNVDGYTSGLNSHISFENSNSTFYNWYFYLTYVSENNNTKNLYYEFDSSTNVSWTPSEGLPYIMKKVENFNGRTLWQFRCPCKHNLKIDEFVNLQGTQIKDSAGANLNRSMIFQVYSLGDGTKNSEEKIFNILDLNYYTDETSNTSFHDGQTGKFFRVINEENPVESKSQYYIREHKVITKWSDAIITNAGFEQNAFRTVRKFYPASLTPNNVSRVAIKEDSQSYNISFNGTVDLSGLVDNQDRPISELYFTVVNRGFFGYFNPISNNGKALKQGWDFNITPIPNSWWARAQTNSDVNLLTEQYTKSNLNFIYMKSYNVGDLIDGDLCEWNNITQEETVLSENYHKFVYNPSIFNIGTSNVNPYGFYYRPFFKMKIKQYSNYVEDVVKNLAEDVPSYAYFSSKLNSYLWRDLYTIGFFDGDNNGVDYPFMNGRHYPYSNFIFRIIPEGTAQPNYYDIQTPIVDECE